MQNCEEYVIPEYRGVLGRDNVSTYEEREGERGHESMRSQLTIW